ncbi:hypothetical protein GCM10011410_18330 [Hoyosella rhizosphaerae]|uniref:YdbS-like PH domain-containing protein n=2 Tax=Hoyosella rhizosphaerae TaxID=1755582 RepID=A0A916XEJ7_9ACTN|nr:hypothetical protein GCM10011410_18330 [Hoyosella rhizosphaerae]
MYRHPHWKMLIGPIIVVIFATGIAGVLIGALEANAPGGAREVGMLAVVCVWALVVSRRFVRPYVSWWRTALVITTHRIAIREGLFKRRGFDIPLQRVAGVRYKRGMLDRIAHTGTLCIAPIGEPPFEFAHVPEAKLTHAVLYHQIFGNTPAPRQRKFFGLVKAR